MPPRSSRATASSSGVSVGREDLGPGLWLHMVLVALSGLPNMASQVRATSKAQQLCPPAVLEPLLGLVSAPHGRRVRSSARSASVSSSTTSTSS